jgi:endoglucanase
MNEGTEYEWSFDARSTVDRTVSGRIQINGGDYHAYFVTPVELTSEMKSYSFSFKMEEASDPAPRMCFNMGMQDDNKQFKDHDIYFDNIRLVVKDDSGAVASTADEDVSGIRLNQIGTSPVMR